MLSRALALFLTVNLLLGSLIDLHDLAKVPYMISHFQQHRNTSVQFSFKDFLNLHYGSESNHDAEGHKQDSRLPFKNHDCQNTHLVTLLVAFHPAEKVIPVMNNRYTNFYH